MKKLMMLLVLLTLAFGSQADTLIWEPMDDNNSGELLGEPTFEDLKWQIAIFMTDYETQVRVGWEVVVNFIEETIDYVISNLRRDNYTTEEQFEEHKVFFEAKIREFKANYNSGVAHFTAFFGIREFFVDIDEEV